MRWASQRYRKRVHRSVRVAFNMNLNREFTSETASFSILPTAKREFMPVDVAEVTAPRGNWVLPAVNEVRLGLILLRLLCQLAQLKRSVMEFATGTASSLGIRIVRVLALKGL